MKDSIAVIGGFIGGLLSYCFGNSQDVTYLLFIITLDIFIGVLACFVNPRLMFNSCKMRTGLIHKVIVIALVAFSHQLDYLCNTDGIIMKMVCWCFITNEFLSCIENMGKCGVKYPKILQNSLEQLKGDNR